MNKNVKVCYPRKEIIYSFQKEVSGENIYQAVKVFEQEKIERIKFDKIKRGREDILLGSIINLHNKEGICCLERIRNMASCIKQGQDIFENKIWPNIKLAQTNEGLILFDGHHSLLAYMAVGKKYLWEIPYILVSNCSDSEIKVVFGKLNGDWKKEVVNWQASLEEQLCIRREKNLGELFNSLRADICLHNG
jgi:hypothetical protein